MSSQSKIRFPSELLYVLAIVLIAGIGGLSISFGAVTLTAVATALILGILTNVMLSKEKDETQKK